MKHTCKIRRIGIHTAWITIEDAPNRQPIAVPLEVVASNHDPDGPYPGNTVKKLLPCWVLEVAGVE